MKRKNKYHVCGFSDAGQFCIETSLFVWQIINMYGELIMEATQHKVSAGVFVDYLSQKLFYIALKF